MWHRAPAARPALLLLLLLLLLSLLSSLLLLSLLSLSLSLLLLLLVVVVVVAVAVVAGPYRAAGGERHALRSEIIIIIIIIITTAFARERVCSRDSEGVEARLVSSGSRMVGFHNFNLRILNLRVSNPNKFIVDIFLTRCRISMCQDLGPRKHDEISEIDRGCGQMGLPFVCR